MSEDEDQERQRRQAAQTLAIYDALVLAMQRRHEVLAAIDTSADEGAALAAVAELLDVHELQAQAVLDVQLRRMTTQGRERIVAERDRLRDLLTSD